MRALLNILFFHWSATGHVTEVRFPHLATSLDRLLFLLAGGVGIGLVIWFYRREPSYVTVRRKTFLASLRIGTVLLLLYIATGAVVIVSHVTHHKGVLAFLVDSSASMGIVDHPSSTHQRQLERRLLGHPTDNGVSRTALLQGAFANPKMAIAESLKNNFHVRMYTFGESSDIASLMIPEKPGSTGWLSNLQKPNQKATQLGAAISAAARHQRGRRLDGIVVFTDGGWNRGENPIVAARGVHVPVYTVGVGLPHGRDISIPFVSCDSIVFKDDAFPLLVRIKNRGFAGESTVLTISSINSAGQREIIRRRNIILGPNGESTSIVHIIPDHAGLFTYQATLSPMPGEVNVANNAYDRPNVQVIDKKMRILLADNTPDWNFRFIRKVISDDRRRLTAKVYLRYGSLAGQTLTSIRRFPSTAKAINQYDAIILGDINPHMLDARQFHVLENWIKTSGGGLMVIAGPNYMPRQFGDSPLMALLPVIPGHLSRETLHRAMHETISRGFRPRRTNAGKVFEALRFSADPARNASEWARAKKMYWCYPVRRLKPAAIALLADPDRLMGSHAMPVLATQRYGEGKVMFFATDESWRWRTRPGPRAFTRIWAELISNLAMTHLLGNASRTHLEIDKSIVRVGDHVHLLGRVLTASYSPLLASSVIVRGRHALQSFTITLRADQQTHGLFHATFVPRMPGRYLLHLPGVMPTSRGSTVLLNVTHENLELVHSRVRVGLLKQIAQAGGGAYVPLWQLQRLPVLLQTSKRTAVAHQSQRTIWNAPLVIVLLALCLGTEWFFRKRFDLL